MMGLSMPNPHIIAGPTYFPLLRVWEISVAIPGYSPKLAARRYHALPETIHLDGRTYIKAGMKADTLTAWYRTKRI
jgi:hypothetical protein